MKRGVRGLAAGALALITLAAGAGAAQAQGPVLENGKTKAVYDYTQAVRERVFIPQPGIDQDANGVDDFVTVDIIRPRESSATNKMPAIIDPSPYYTTVCRGNESQCMADFDGDNVNDRWPLFYDNYFVPRGYAYVLAQMNGTGYTEHGCPMHGGPGDIAGEKSVVDWLNGRVKAYRPVPGTSTTPDLTNEAVADWHNGSSAMIGKSYDGTLANGVAATGVEGLKTIVPISAISAWYNYSRVNGIISSGAGTNYPAGLNNNITTPGGSGNPTGVNLPGRRTICSPRNNIISDDANYNEGDGDVHADINKFWDDRDYIKGANKIKAAVFATHGFQDDNVRTDHIGMWWEALKANNVPRKLWLLRAGHEDPFDSRRDVWVDTLHRWFDHWLYGVENGIMDEPPVTIEDGINQWADYGDWPIPGTENVDVFLRGAENASQPGTLGGSSGGAQDQLTFTATNQSETNLMANPTGSQANKRVFLSGPLTQDVRLSGTVNVDISAIWGSACATQTVGSGAAARTFRRCPGVSVIVADLGPSTQISRSDEGLTNTSTRRCYGDGAPGNVCEGKAYGETCQAPTGALAQIENACYMELTRPTTSVNSWRVARASADIQNRDSLFFEEADLTPVTVTDKYRVRFPALPVEHTFPAGHQIAVIVGGLNTNMVSTTGGRPNNVPVTLDTRVSKITLPIKGGYRALAAAGATDAETVPPVLGDDVPADILVATTDASGTTVSYTKPSATDNEDPNPVVTCDPASGSTFPVGVTTVTCVATDANGNVSEPKTFKVTVRRDVPVSSDVSGTVPATLSLTLGPAADFGAFTPGVTKTYLASTAANVISTAGDALLTVSDPSSVGTGHLVNGSFILPQPLQARARNADNTGTAFNNIGASLNLLSWSAPVSNDAVTLEFSQLVNANDPLRTGTYSKALTFTLSTTTP